ncbi:PD-(D/E)XK nuclease family protein [Tunturibacter empetritectus]|uniref:DNA repair protein n=1 Tax=Tunturiibacter empetritectus TaxID=3069691 RepID=A0A7W8MQN8_9BACT|nr:PD-(D/E)XK nuclease family protein [Edaphobacter lichenicola]MBB5316015.1 putative DNA repair protein [Edaphobacter lichenicola]
MDGRGLLPGGIAEALEQGSVVVTGNQRAARAIRRGWDRRNRALGLASWSPAAVTSWDAWLANMWQRLLVEGHVTSMMLNHSQEQVVWRTILEADDELASLRTVDTLAAMAADAWRLVCSYDGRLNLQAAIGNSDTRSFQRWARTFERLCEAEGFVAQAQLEDTLREEVEREAARSGFFGVIADRVVLVGFDQMTPSQSRLVEALHSTGIQVEELRLNFPAQRRFLVEAADGQEELFLAARWVRRFLEENTGATIAVIVPALEKERREIDRVFREVLAPELEDIRADDHVGPYEFSLGSTLRETPLVAAAFDLLRWSNEPLPLERVSALLLSPYFAMSSGERSARAEFDAFELRKARVLRPEISLRGLVEMMDGSKRRAKFPQVLGTLRAMQRVAGRLQGLDERSHAEWAEKMREFLMTAAWGSGGGDTSVEFQTQRKWESALDEVATLDFDGVAVDYAQALEALERVARLTMFAPESREAPVQVMGPLEAAGSTFDAVWFLHAGELDWPMPAVGSSLLPWHLQRELEMPGTDPTLDSERAQRITERIAASAGSIVFSYAKESSEGNQRPSPLLTGIGLETVKAAEFVESESQRTIVELEDIADAAQVQAPPDRVIRGGAKVLELQAACGFRAFAEKRLWATELESIEPGMDARESGTALHKALEIFWDEVKTQDNLRSMTMEERDEALIWCVARALKKTAEASATDWDKAYVEVQRERLRRLLSGWLELELERRLPFEVKLSEKEFKDVRVGPLRLSVRMDRVDVVEGGEVLIDYKTGSASPNDWLTQRPTAPQLPLYAILSQADQLQGVAFGLVKAGKDRGLQGYAASDGVLPKPTRLKEAATLEAQVERWREVLVRLAEEFYSGDARVSPKTYPGTCAHCGQRIFCRLNVSLLEEDDEQEDGSVAEVSRG